MFPLLHRLAGILVSPAATFRVARDDTVRQLAVYFLVLLAANAVLTAAWASRPGEIDEMLFSPADAFVLPLILWPVIIAGFSILLFIAQVIAGGGSIRQTLIAVVYGSTPFLLTAWVLGISGWLGGGMDLILIIFGGGSPEMAYLALFSLWSLALAAVGVKELSGRSWQFALFSVGAAAFAFMVVAFFLAVFLFALAWGLGGADVLMEGL